MSNRAKDRRNKGKRHNPLESAATPSHSKTDGCRSIPPAAPKWKQALDLVVALLALVSIILWLPSYSPNIHIDHRGETDPKVAFNVVFSITNEGYFAVSQLDVECRINGAYLANGASVEGMAISMSKGMHVAELERSDTYDVICPFDSAFRDKGEPVIIQNANIDIAVTFKPRQWWPYRLLKCANFRTIQNIDGNLSWLQRPADLRQCAGPTTTLMLMQPEN